MHKYYPVRTTPSIQIWVWALALGTEACHDVRSNLIVSLFVGRGILIL